MWKPTRSDEDAVRLFRKLWINRTLFGWTDKDRRRATWLIKEMRRHRRIEPEKKEMGKLAQAKGNRKENRVITTLTEFVPQQDVRSRRIDEAIDIQVGADIEVNWWWMPLLIQCKHAKEISVRAAWRKLVKVNRNQYCPMLAVQWSALRDFDLAVLDKRDFDYLLDEGHGPKRTWQEHRLQSKHVSFKLGWARITHYAALNKADPLLTVRYDDLECELVVIRFNTFIEDYRATYEVVGPDRPLVVGGEQNV